jgi:hypothetical protein
MFLPNPFQFINHPKLYSFHGDSVVKQPGKDMTKSSTPLNVLFPCLLSLPLLPSKPRFMQLARGEVTSSKRRVAHTNTCGLW